MATYRPKGSGSVEALSFEEFLEYGRANCDPGCMHGNMPCSFKWQGLHASHERDDCYVITFPNGFAHFKPGQMVIRQQDGTGYVVIAAAFLDSYEPA